MSMGFTFFRRTSGRSINVAAFHSPHSLTWSWILSATLSHILWPKPYCRKNTIDFGAGLGQMIGFHTYTTNGGRHWSLSLLWVCLSWDRQKPMYYRGLYIDARDARDRLANDNRELRNTLAAFFSARDTTP